MAENQDRRRRFTRREFLAWTWAASLIGLFGQASGALLNFFKPRIEPGAFGTKVIAGQVDEFAPGTVNHIQKGRFFISRLEDGSFLALWHRCTHLGCTIPWREEEGQFNCPCHSTIFNTVGEVVSGPAPRPMDLFPIQIEEGQLLVDTSNPIQRDRFDPSQSTPA
jgi:cytochrome b6-f complex iron-sulfur subunit